jgi:hypothetical protein
MEFTSIVGNQHTIEPIGYHQLRKKLRSDVKIVVRSIREQFLIHSLASDFQSTHIFIPSPLRIESSKSYIMDMVYNFGPMHPSDYKNIPELFEELIRFKNYMYVRGYFAAGFSLLHRPGLSIFVLVDFSQFGTIDFNFVMFPKIPIKYTILEAETQFGLIGRDIVTQSFKNKHTQSKSPRIIPEILTCVFDFPELELNAYTENALMDEETISIRRGISEILFESLGANEYKETEPQLEKIDSLLTDL